MLELPVAPDSIFSCWFRPTGHFNFPQYLMMFLAAIGCPEVQVFNTMDGMFLVPYQAVVRRSQWEAVSESFETAWKLHKMAYRKLNSTKHAPTISEARKPRFADVPENIRDDPPSLPLQSLISVHNTFIEVDEDLPEQPFLVRTKSV
ncbi:unnamed protein product [Effrenium voratum]|nr:unnamed protein product [Effrenium voratum]CAJ1439416.1 unnamed protein product [Effrenium voratum]